MSRLSRTVLIPLAVAFTFMLPGPPGGQTGTFFGLGFGPAPAAADLLQCMESCIRHEGGNTAANKATCKSRCANVPTALPGAGGRDCMAVYKDCNAACAKNKKCRRGCKKRLMRCK